MLSLAIFLTLALLAFAGVLLEHWWTTPRKAGKHTSEARRRATGRDLAYQTLRVGLRTALGMTNRTMPQRSAHAMTTSRRFDKRAWENFFAAYATA